MNNRERVEVLGSLLWLLMDGFWMMEWIWAAKACFAAVIVLLLVFGISSMRLRRLRLTR